MGGIAVFRLKRMMLGLLLISLGNTLLQIHVAFGLIGIPFILLGAFYGFVGYYLWDDDE